MKTTITVRYQVPGFHFWPTAMGHRAYLAERHRHLFYVEATLEVFHDEREVELHDLMDFCRDQFPGGERGGQSVETMARTLATAINGKWPGRLLRVSVFEDGEAGATVETSAKGMQG